MNSSNRAVSFFVAITAAIAIFISSTQGVDAFSGSGAGTVGDPYQINSCVQLQEINDDLDAHYLLTNNIDCAETATWNVNVDEWVEGDTNNDLIPDSYTGVINNGYFGFNPIGRENAISVSGPGFTGTFNGNGYTISNIWIFRKEQPHIGLFGYATGATIQNVMLDDARIVGQQNVGAFVGYGSGVTLQDLTNNEGMVRAYLSYRGGGIGGEIESSSSLQNVQVIGGTVHGSGNIIGGLVGRLSSSTVSDSETSAAVDGGEYVGGAFGEVIDSQLADVYATGSVDSNLSEGWAAKTGNYSGGFAGRITNSAIIDSYATGSVSSEGYYTGGFAGIIEGTSTVENSYATGAVSSDQGNTGGFVGAAFCGPSFTQVYATGNVTAVGSNVGGFVGSDGCEGPGATYNQVLASGSVSGADRIGGFVGESYYSDFTNVYASGSVTGTDIVGGFGGYLFYPKLAKAYSRGLVTGTTNTGGFAGIHYVGTEDRVISDSFFDSETSGQNNAIGDGEASGVTAKTSTEMKTLITFTDAGWDFDAIWEIGSDNEGYPYFGFETLSEEPSDTTAPVLTLITPIASTTTVANAVLTFSTNEACNIIAEQPISSTGAVELIMDSTELVGVSRRAYLSGIQVGGTYSFRFLCRDLVNNASNIISSGTFTVIAEPVASSGQGSPWRSTNGSGNSNSTTNTNTSTSITSTTCPADQLLTQNLRAGARDGRFHPYTRGVVKEVKILQGHMNRLGFNSGKVDGILGRITDGAIKRMQTYLGTPADGLIGPKTRALINNSCGNAGLVR